MPRAHIFLLLVSVVFVCGVVAADEPRLTPADVGRAADTAARQQGYDLKAYTRGEPSYDPVSKTWGVNYRLKSSQPDSTGNGVLSVAVSDTTGFASTRFWLATPTPAPPTQPPSSRDIVLFFCELAGGVVLALAPFARAYSRARWAQAVFAITAALLLFVSTSELLRAYHIWILSPQMEHGFSYTLALLRGVVIGFLLALLFSGELPGRKVGRERPNQSLEATAGCRDAHI